MRKILIVGGDRRNLELANILSKEDKITILGFENCEIEKNIIIENNLEEAIKQNDIIITAIPVSKDGVFFYAPFSKEKIDIDCFTNLCRNKLIITGNILMSKQELLEKENQVIDIIKMEEYAILNAEPTAEGAIQIAMENTYEVLQGRNVLIIGYGKIGKILSNKLKQLDCNVYSTARKETDFATMDANGLIPVRYENLNEKIRDMDIIFNTVPNIILKEDELNNIKKDAIVIELASKPGGVDLEKNKTIGVKVINAQGLPGKVAPITSAKIIEKILKQLFEIIERGK